MGKQGRPAGAGEPLSEAERQLLLRVSNLRDLPEGPFSLRLNGRNRIGNPSPRVEIAEKPDGRGLVVRVQPGVTGETIHVPVLLSQTGLRETVCNDFLIGAGCDVSVIAGCGIRNCGEGASEHSGIHRFLVGRGARVRYEERHIGEGDGTGERIMNPETVVELAEDSRMEMIVAQLGGLDAAVRTTEATLAARASLLVRERIMTRGTQTAETRFRVSLNGEDSSARVVSRSVARDESRQIFRSFLRGASRCAGRTECDAILMDGAHVSSVPEIAADHPEATLIHEAAIGRIAGEQLVKLMTLGLSEKEAEERIIRGFLR